MNCDCTFDPELMEYSPCPEQITTFNQLLNVASTQRFLHAIGDKRTAGSLTRHITNLHHQHETHLMRAHADFILDGMPC